MNSDEASIAVAAAMMIDRAFGEPPRWLHPVVWMGRAARRLGRVSGDPARELLTGAAVVAIVSGTAATGAWLVTSVLSSWLGVIVAAMLLSTTFAVRGLRAAALEVAGCLERGDVAGARRALPSLCSRDPADLDQTGLAGSAVQSVAENACDSVVAPLLFFGLFGLPGAMFYRAVNTLDAVLGYRGRTEYLGKPAARLDDLLNLIPARVTAGFIVIAAALAGGDARRAARTWWRCAARTPSPNGGRPMAAMAGGLGVVLTKPGAYVLDGGARPPTARCIRTSCRFLEVVAGLALATALALCWRGAHG